MSNEPNQRSGQPFFVSHGGGIFLDAEVHSYRYSLDLRRRKLRSGSVAVDVSFENPADPHAPIVIAERLPWFRRDLWIETAPVSDLEPGASYTATARVSRQNTVVSVQVFTLVHNVPGLLRSIGLDETNLDLPTG